jgi:DNA-binding FadR family transcriptional regulator
MTKARTYPRRGLHGELVHDIGIRILRGELQPGDPIPMSGGSGTDAAPDVSRTVLRETVKVLAAKGLVVSRPKTGTHVRDRAFWNLMDPDVLAWRLEAEPGDEFFVDVFELRRLLEPAAAALAAERALPPEVAALQAAYAQMEEYVDRNPGEYIAADIRFHEVILNACHNELLGHLGSTLRATFRASFTRTNASATQTLPMHGAVLDAIRTGDGPAAEAAMLDLIDTTALQLGANAAR